MSIYDLGPLALVHLLTPYTTMKLNITTTANKKFAVLVSPVSTAKYIANGIFWVFPGMFPATIRVAPNSPKALAKARTVPLSIPGRARGILTFQNTFLLLAPNEQATSSKLGSTFKKALLQLWYIKGSETMVAAIQAAIQVKISLTPKMSYNNFPIIPLFPINISSPYPTTVGGNTIGNRRTTSKISFPLKLYFVVNLDKDTPIINVIIVDITATFIDIIIGLSIILFTYSVYILKPYFSKISFALSVLKYCKNSKAASLFLVEATTAAGYTIGV